MSTKFVDISKSSSLTRISSFALTINTNQDVRDPKKRDIALGKLKDYVDTISQQFEEYLIPYRRYRDDSGETTYQKLDMTAKEIEDVIISGSIDSSYEMGEKFHKGHVHVSITIESEADYNWFINTDKIRAELPEGTHVWSRYIPDSSYGWKKYNRKTK